MNQPQETRNKLEQALSWIILAYQALAVVAFLVYLVLAIRFMQMPFLGAFIDGTLIVNAVHPSPAPGNWSMIFEGAQFKDQVVSLEGQPVRRFAEISEILETRFAGENVSVVLKTPTGETKELSITLGQFRGSDFVNYFAIPYIVGLFYLAISLWVFGIRRTESAGRAFIIFATSAAVSSAGLLDNYSSHVFTWLWGFTLALSGGALLHLALVFPQEVRILRKLPFLIPLGYVLAGAMGIYSAATVYLYNQPFEYLRAWSVIYAYLSLAALFFLAMMLYRRFGAKSPVVKQQSGVILLGALLAFGPVGIWFLASAVMSNNFDPRLLIPLVVFPIVTGYTVQKSRILRTDYLVSQAVLYTALILMATGAYLVLTIAAGVIFGTFLPPNSPILIGVMIALLVLLTDPIRLRLKLFVDTAFFRGEKAYQERLQQFSRQLTSSVALPDVLRVLREQIVSTLMPARLHIYIYDATNDQYVATVDETGVATSDINFARSNPLVKTLSSERLPFFFDEEHPDHLMRGENARLLLLGTTLFVAMPGKDKLVGWVALGERLSGQAYSSADLNFLESICDQAAVAIERAQIVSNMERRVQEMNVLSRVAQGVNITLRFDDILELIYAQASQVVPSTDFHLVLFNKAGQYFYFAFYLEADDRIARMENKPLPAKSSLEQEVALLRRPIVSADYLRECQIYGVNAAVEGIYAWAGVPLNAGAETLGAMGVGSRDPSVIYTPRQVELLQNIADQAAGAIVKARLLEESERRARQLSTLNLLTRQLTSTLETEPLLKNLLESAVAILNTEAGSLFLVDEQTDELVFRVTVGPVASNLVGQRLPAGSGVVGRVVETRSPVVENEVQASPQWNASPDRQTGFVTRAILAVPLEVKDKVIGVLEVINKRDGFPFTEEDQNLLAAFAGQAAVAIENARLYTLTDQELTARVEELSVMQRIDRELNASLEIDRAMRITLEWAMRQSNSDAGLIGILTERGVRLMAHQGYGDKLAEFEQSFIPLEHPAIEHVAASAQAQVVILEEGNNKAFLPGARSQLVIPIRREAKAIGLFLLESTKAELFSEQAQAFLSRLSDHAAIAIANAQLYAQIDNANRAKSQFVSFVAHELKNPMASIKGYTELVAGGMAGPINEMQSKFLSTVRSNVDRMNTIVSDLSDLNKIEAGMLKLEFRPVDTSEVLEESVRSLRRQIEEKEQLVETSIEPGLPMVWADRNRMIQIAVNLVSNATKYTPKSGQISIGAEIWRGEGENSESLRLVHIWVKDTGIGISPEDQKKVFSEYFRTESSKEMASGTGLGLTITKKLVEMQGGKIWFNSEVGKGTTFHFTVPVSEN